MEKRKMLLCGAGLGLAAVVYGAVGTTRKTDSISATTPETSSSTSLQQVMAAAATAPQAAASTTTSDWAKLVNGSLTYRTTAKGDRIMDFSTAGFAGGGVALPTGVPVRITLSPSGGDDTAAIQQAINTVSALDRGTDRYRGIVKLAPGTFKVSSTITINATGVIVAGSGSGTGGTIVQMTGSTGFLAFQFGVPQAPITSGAVDLTSSYIKSGSNAVRVSSVSGFTVGQRVLMSRKVTSDWIHYVGMDTLVRNGQPQTWLAPSTTIDTPRAIKAIDASTKTITFDAPVTDSLDSTYLGSPVGSLSAVTNPGRILWVGMEHLRIQAPSGTTVYSAVKMNNVMNGYLSDVSGQETQNAFTADIDAQQITFDNVINKITTVQTAAAPTADFSVTGSQVLLNKCASQSNGTWSFVTSSIGVGPAVLLNFTTTNSVGIGPHQRWYTGLLVDNASLPNATTSRPGIAFTNRGTAGSGQGWTLAWGVAWNVTSPYFKVQSPPGTLNWCIGCNGSDVSPAPVGTFDAQGASVTPASLYLQQLKDRLGISAVNAIGYATVDPTS